MTLVEFLLARIAEDEAVANSVRPDEYLATRDDSALFRAEARGRYPTVAARSGRVRVECAAKRAIIAFVTEHHEWDEPYLLGFLAEPYKGHADFDSRWVLAGRTE